MVDWREEIEKLVGEESRAWNEGDAQAYSAHIASDCVFTNIFGQVFEGRAAFEQQHAAIFATIYGGSRMEQSVDYLRLVAPGVVVVDTSVTVSVPTSEFAPSRTLRTRLVQTAVQQGDRWIITSYHNVEERPTPTL